VFLRPGSLGASLVAKGGPEGWGGLLGEFGWLCGSFGSFFGVPLGLVGVLLVFLGLPW